MFSSGTIFMVFILFFVVLCLLLISLYYTPPPNLQRQFSLPQVYWTKSITMMSFIFIIPHSHTVSVWEPTSMKSKWRQTAVEAGEIWSQGLSSMDHFGHEGHQAPIFDSGILIMMGKIH